DSLDAAGAVAPDRDRAGEADEHRQTGKGQRAEEGRQRRLELENAEPDDDDGDQHRHDRKYGQITRPGREARHGFRLVGSRKPARHRFNSAGLDLAGPNGPDHRTSVVDLTFASVPPRVLKERISNPKPHQNPIDRKSTRLNS